MAANKRDASITCRCAMQALRSGMAIKSFSTQWSADEVKFFTVEVNQCSKVVVSQQIGRVPSAVSSLSDPISDDQLTELVGKMR